MVADKVSMVKVSAPSELNILCGVIANLIPEHLETGLGRQININATSSPSANELEAATSALADKAADSYVNAEVVLKLLDAIEALGRTGIRVDTLRSRVTAHVERRWPYFVESLVTWAFETYQPSFVFSTFPRLRSEAALFTRLAASIAVSLR